MSGGGGDEGGGTTVQKTEPWDEAKPYYERLYRQAEDAYGKVDKTPYLGKLVADKAGMTGAAEASAQQMIPGFRQNAQMAQDLAQKTSQGDFLNASTNPYLQSAIDIAQGSTTRSFNQDVLPQLRSAAISGGAYGGSRDAVALGMASDSLQRNLSDTAAQMAYQNYATERGYQNKSGDMLTQANALAKQPAAIQAALGQAEEQRQQAIIDSEIKRKNANALASMQGLGQYSSIIGAGGFNSSTGTITPSGGGGSSALTGALSGAAGGAMAGSAILPGWGTAIGGLIGGIAGGLS